MTARLASTGQRARRCPECNRLVVGTGKNRLHWSTGLARCGSQTELMLHLPVEDY